MHAPKPLLVLMDVMRHIHLTYCHNCKVSDKTKLAYDSVVFHIHKNNVYDVDELTSHHTFHKWLESLGNLDKIVDVMRAILQSYNQAHPNVVAYTFDHMLEIFQYILKHRDKTKS